MSWNLNVKKIAAAGLCGGMLLVSSSAVSRPAQADTGLAGHWQATDFVHCDVNPGNAGICQRLLLTLGTYANYESITSDAAGNITYQGGYVASSAHAQGAQPACNPYIFVQPFSGVCVVTHHGSGVVKSSGTSTGLPDFIENDETATFYNPDGTQQTVVDPLTGPLGLFGVTAYPLDTGIPAVVGHYDIAAYLKLLGYTGPTASVTIDVNVIHTS